MDGEDILTEEDLIALVRESFFDALEGRNTASLSPASDEVLVMGDRARSVIRSAVAGAVRELNSSKLSVSQQARDAIDRLSEASESVKLLWCELESLEASLSGQTSPEASGEVKEPYLVKVTRDLSRPRFDQTKHAVVMTEPGVSRSVLATVANGSVKPEASDVTHKVSAWVPLKQSVGQPNANTSLVKIETTSSRVKSHGFEPESNLGLILGHLLENIGVVVRVEDLFKYIRSSPKASSLTSNVSSNVARLKRQGYRILGSSGSYKMLSEIPDHDINKLYKERRAKERMTKLKKDGRP